MATSGLSKRRKELRSDLSTIEKQIYDLETHYLEDTRDVGNIFTGWDLFLANDKVKIKKQIFRDERLVSLSRLVCRYKTDTYIWLKLLLCSLLIIVIVFILSPIYFILFHFLPSFMICSI